MKKILIFSGTTEGRTLSEMLASRGVAVEVCVATEYGEQMMEENDFIKVHTGRMDANEMEHFFSEHGFDVVVDATHPFATIVTENILQVTSKLNIQYLRVEREIIESEEKENNLFFENTAECIEALKHTTGNILLTTGSKELKLFCEDEGLKSRIIARILPGIESLQIAYDCGLDGRQIIAMHGPFSQSMNENILREYNISCLVTKESGKAGGMEEKINACKNLKVPCYIIKRPVMQMDVQTYSAKEAYRKLISPENEVMVSLVGIGMGDTYGLSIKAQNAIEEADIIFGASRMLEIVESGKLKYPYYMEKDIVPVLIAEGNKKKLKAAVLFSGDTGFFSGCEKLYKALLEYENIVPEIIPGASSISYFSSKLGISWQDAKIISAHGVDKNIWTGRLINAVSQNEKVFFITSGPKDIVTIGEIFENSFEDLTIHLGYELSYENEEITTVSVSECKKIEKPGLYVGMIINKNYESGVLTPGISDEEFIRDKVPMTKQEVRTLSIAKLGLKRDSVVYDVGSGTGSVAVEMALLSPEIKVFAIEINDLALDLIHQNCEKFGVKNVEIVKALAPESFEELPVPTHAFIGGSKGNLETIISTLREKNPGIRIVVNTVSMENLAEIQRVLEKLKIDEADICCVNISKAKKLGDYHLMQANNPVYIITF